MPCVGLVRPPTPGESVGTDRVRNQDVADEKDTDSAPDEGLTESGSVTPENGAAQDEYAELDALDEREDEFDDVADADQDQADDLDDDLDQDVGGDRELVGVGATSKARTAQGSSRTVARSDATGRGRKGRATPKQRTGEDRPDRSGPISFARGSVSELKKVVYPTWPQLLNYFVVVLVFVLIIIAIVAGLDYGFGWLMLKAFT